MMRMFDKVKGDFVDVKYEAMAPSEIVVVFEPNRPSYELRRIK